MEALARCSRVLYDVELLEVMKKLRYLENKDKTPQVKFEHKDAWIHSRTNFKTAVILDVIFGPSMPLNMFP